MKLVKIEDVRIGQVWGAKFDTNRTIVIKNVESEQIDVDVFADKQFYCENNFNKDISGLELIGFIDITHEIKDNKLVEITRANLEVDDVVMFKDGTQRQYVIIEEQKEYSSIFANSKRYKCMHEKYGDRELYDFELKKIGIYGVTHEFVNERLVK